ncbi:hypothetical protein [Micromonospora inaquosa]|uniref:hypothetical protein n=1 Tax=Micromonospora inaquosa TaxID=2203716 RepID=UPI000F5E1A9F|nr:hypothetical protein [Micromonospora inaquosa]
MFDGIPAAFRPQIEEPAFGDEGGQFLATAARWRQSGDDRWNADICNITGNVVRDSALAFALNRPSALVGSSPNGRPNIRAEDLIGAPARMTGCSEMVT